jgi:hypothetical protein
LVRLERGSSTAAAARVDALSGAAGNTRLGVARSLEELVSGSNGDGASVPGLEQVEVSATEDALTLRFGDGEGARVEDIEHGRGPTGCDSFSATLLESTSM